MRPEASRSCTLSGSTCRDSSVRAARSLRTGTSALARRSSSSRVRDSWATPSADLTGLTAPPCYAGPASEREPEGLGQKSHQGRRAPARRHVAGRKVGRAGLALAELDAGREGLALEILDERMVGIEPARRALEARLVVRETDSSGLLPATRIPHDRLADRAEGVGARMPEARAHEDPPGLQVQVVAGGLEVPRGLETEVDPDVGLVGRLVAAEARVAIDPHQRAPVRSRVDRDVTAKPRERRRERADQRQHRIAHLGQIAVLVLVEPLAVVVTPELAEKREDVAGDGRHTSSDRAMQTAVDVDALARDVTGPGRAQERRQERDVGRVAEVAERDALRELVPALLRWMQPLVDLLAVHAPGRQAVDRDPVPPHLSREALRPRVPARLGGAGRIDPRGLCAAGDAA